MSIEQLTQLISPPSTPSETGSDEGWIAIERELGTRLPLDYRQFITQYGSGLLADFLVIYNPFSENKPQALIPKVQKISARNRELADIETRSLPFANYPEAPGLLACGHDENGNELYWFTEGEPDEWGGRYQFGQGCSLAAIRLFLDGVSCQSAAKGICLYSLASGFSQPRRPVRRLRVRGFCEMMTPQEQGNQILNKPM